MKEHKLRRLYQEHQGKVSDKWSVYLDTYETLFAEYVHQSARVLEIGIQNGGSLEIMARFLPQAERIVGCDIDPLCEGLRYEDPRIAVIVGDAVSDEVQARVLALCPSFDLVIDDGSHTSRDIVRAFARYFPTIREGGAFVAEDLHCSYWAAFEGGLFHPQSSLAFFRALVDVINHEHWGVPGGRRRLISAFEAAYDVELDEAVLAQIHAVEFVNSLCIVRKAAAPSNELGARVIAGTVAHVDRAGLTQQLDGTRVQVPDQQANEHAQRSAEERLTAALAELEAQQRLRIEAEARLRQSNGRAGRLADGLRTESRRAAELEQRCAGLSDTVDALRQSTSWRLTEPVRWVGHRWSRIRLAATLLPVVWRRVGDLPRVARRVRQILRTHGLPGVWQVMSEIEAEEADHAHRQAEARNGDSAYGRWVHQFDVLSDADRLVMAETISGWPRNPLISIVMPTYNGDPAWLAQAVASVQAQVYGHWELCIADDASSDSTGLEALQRLADLESRIKIVRRPENGHISAASNSALELATGEWIVLMDHDDLLAEHALFWVAETIQRHPEARMIYSDEDKIDEQGHRFDPYFKSDWNIDLFRSHNMFSHLGAFEAALVRDVGGFRIGLEGSQDYDLVLRCSERVSPDQIRHIPRVLYHWRVHAQSTASSSDVKPYAQIAGERALNEHLARLGVDGETTYIGHGYRTHYRLPRMLPHVTIIIPTRNAVHLVRQCIESLVSVTDYAAYDVILVDNGSDAPEALAYFDQLARDPKFTVLRHDAPFNYSELNNLAVDQARGEFVCLLNNDVEITSAAWLAEMVSIALQPGVGAVGARLWYPDGTLQHAGVVLGIGGVAAHPHKSLAKGELGYFGRAALIQSFSAVTAACLVVSKANYLRVGGLDAANLAVAFNDVDFCLRLREAGLRNVWTPYAELIHHESVSRGRDDSPEKQARFNAEVDYMTRRWGALLQNDPAYNPNLTLLSEDFSLAWPPRLPTITLR
ncbi:glycosyltransferase [uncultured Pseudacidovorax sp.]|uniref:glycosyltransferase n=1 Tax=uncultured Pseudacidovorax sp. TaxID=679313 RepID=UPI00345D08E4